jgi:glucose-6-phosphate 1-dehydrogenase
MTEEIYQAEQDYNKYQELINTKEILTQEEYEFCKAWDAEEAWKYLNNIGPAWENGGFNGSNRYLNINVYSEADKEEYDLRREMGF